MKDFSRREFLLANARARCVGNTIVRQRGDIPDDLIGEISVAPS